MTTNTPAGSLAATGVVPGFPAAARIVARGSTALALLGALVIWLALLGPFAVLIRHLSFHPSGRHWDRPAPSTRSGCHSVRAQSRSA